MGHGRSFFVDGLPKPQGSKKAVPLGKKGLSNRRVVIVEMAGEPLKRWRQAVHDAAAAQTPLETNEALSVRLYFRLPIPKSRAKKIEEFDLHVSRPDLDKLIRAVLDSLTSAELIIDDSMVSMIVASKCYSQRPGCLVSIEPANPQP